MSKFYLPYLRVSGVYKITNKLTGEFYIGASINIGRRWAQHLACSTLEIQKDIQEKGVENFTFEVLEKAERKLLGERELYYINLLNPGYNREKVSRYPVKEISLEARKRHSEINKLRTYYKDPKYRERQSNVQKGKTISPEARKKISESTKGRPKSLHCREAMSKRYSFLKEDGSVVELTNNIASRFMNRGIKLTRL